MSSSEQVLPDEKAVLTGFREALKLFRDLDATMPLQYVTAFLSVAAKER